MKKINVKTSARNQIIDITNEVKNYISETKTISGIITIYSPHTTAGISVNENADPDVKTDMLEFLKKLIPQHQSFQHIEGNSDAHIKGSLLNFSQTFIIENSCIQLGTWQGIFFMEFDGPRNREVWLKIIE
jgi:secondary thiamine-phosphate synthase enzyme